MAENKLTRRLCQQHAVTQYTYMSKLICKEGWLQELYYDTAIGEQVTLGNSSLFGFLSCLV